MGSTSDGTPAWFAALGMALALAGGGVVLAGVKRHS
jgi:LPXTG-motif cell wall-anchored protein